MFTPLLKSERFIREYEMFQADVSQISDQSLKNKLSEELSALKLAVQGMDEAHERLMFGGKNDSEITDLRDKIRTLRQSIDTQIRNYQASH